MGHRIRLIDGEELDVIAKIPLKYLDRPGVKRNVKKKINKRARRQAKTEIRKESA